MDFISFGGNNNIQNQQPDKPSLPSVASPMPKYLQLLDFMPTHTSSAQQGDAVSLSPLARREIATQQSGQVNSDSGDISNLSKEELKNKMEENVSNQNALKSQIDPTKQKTLENDIKKLEDHNKKLQAEIDKSKAQQAKLDTEISSLNNKEQECQQKLDAEKNKTDQNGKPTGNASKFEPELKRIKENEAKKQEELKKAKEAEQAKQKELNDSMQKLTVKKSELETLKTEITELNNKIDALQADHNELYEQLRKINGSEKYSEEGRPHGLSKITEKFGEANTKQTTVEMPCGPDGKMQKVTCHKDIAERMQAAFQEINDSGLSGEIKTFDGCYCDRDKRGSEQKSIHSWGIAFDLNAEENPMKKGQQPTEGQQKLANILQNYGFYNLPGDPMHFQFATGY